MVKNNDISIDVQDKSVKLPLMKQNGDTYIKNPSLSNSPKIKN